MPSPAICGLWRRSSCWWSRRRCGSAWAELETRLRQNSSNSSRPPSSDPPWAPPPPPAVKCQPSGRKPGGQPGHVAHQRVLLPPEQADRLVSVWLEQCRHCGMALPQSGMALPQSADLVASAPERHQMSELPPVQIEVTEYQLQRVRCPCCGKETQAGLPPDVPTGAFGPRLQVAVALLSGRYHLSRRSSDNSWDVCHFRQYMRRL